MALVEWNDTLVTGDAVIDADHKKLVSYVNDLHEGLIKGKGKDTLGPILDKLILYTRQQFAREEGFWTAQKYPQVAVHKKQHANLLATVDDFKKQYDGGKLLLTLQVMDFLSDWLTKHIRGSDIVAARACRAVAA
jgi:hemerythrin